jgi:hypothetical protein
MQGVSGATIGQSRQGIPFVGFVEKPPFIDTAGSISN